MTGTTNISGGTVSLNNASNSSTNLTLSGGFSSGSGALTVPGTFNWTAGTINGTGATTLTNTGTLTISGAGSKQLAIGTFNNAGTATWASGSGALDVGAGAVFNNQGTLTIQSDTSFTNLLESAGSTFNNSGTLMKTAGAGITTFGANTSFSNTGTVKAMSGTLAVNGGFTQTVGTSLTQLNGGAISSTSPMTFTSGTLDGNGTITASVSNTGANVAPGLSPGTLTITGNYTQGAGGTLPIGLASLASFDVLNVTGAATLAGTLTATSIGGFTPVAGNSFQVLTFGSRSGNFTTNNLTVSGVPLDKVFAANNMLLAAPGAAAEIAATSGSGQSTQVNTQFTNQLTATVMDINNVPVSGVSVTFTAPAQTGASATFVGGNSVLTDINGVAAVTIVANSHTGSYSITAMAGAVGPTTFVNLMNTPGPAAALTVETKADGSGTVVPAQNVASGTSVIGFAISRDASGNFVANAAAAWTVANVTGGVVPGDLVAAGNNLSATFTGHVDGSATMHAVVAALAADSGKLTVVAGAGTALSVETKADGSGTVVPAQNVASGTSVTGYAISRDGSRKLRRQRSGDVDSGERDGRSIGDYRSGGSRHQCDVHRACGRHGDDARGGGRAGRRFREADGGGRHGDSGNGGDQGGRHRDGGSGAERSVWHIGDRIRHQP